MYFLVRNRHLAWFLSQVGIGGLRDMVTYQIEYYWNGVYGTVWVPADTDDQAYRKAEKKITQGWDLSLPWDLSMAIKQIRIVQSFKH